MIDDFKRVPAAPPEPSAGTAPPTRIKVGGIIGGSSKPAIRQGEPTLISPAGATTLLGPAAAEAASALRTAPNTPVSTTKEPAVTTPAAPASSPAKFISLGVATTPDKTAGVEAAAPEPQTPKPTTASSQLSPLSPQTTAVTPESSSSLPAPESSKPMTDLHDFDFSNDPVTLGPPSSPPKPPQGTKSPNWFKRHKKLTVALFALILILGGGGGTAAILFNKPKPQPQAVASPEPVPPPEPPKPTTEASRLSGLQIQPELNLRPVTAIMIENSPDARPQSGMLEAGVIFEAIAEGGITRFLCLYQEGMPTYIGPVRSLRPYFLDWLMPFDAAVAHVGGSRDALQQVKDLGLKDLDQFQNSAAYARIPERYAPHNVYTNTTNLDTLNKAKGFTSSKFTSWPRKEDAPSDTPNASSLDFAISGFLYNPHYDYDKTTNTYKRSEGGKPHIDEKTSTQLSPKVVIAMVVPNKPIQGSDGYRHEYSAVGSGKAYIFQDGVGVEATWSKPDRKAQLTFTDAAGEPIKLNAGQTFISMVSAASAITQK